MLKGFYHHLLDFTTAYCAVCEQPSEALLCSSCESSITLPPTPCVQCGRALSEENQQHRCHDCIANPPNFSSFHTLGVYDGVLKTLIINAKVKRQAKAVAALCYLIQQHHEQFPTPAHDTVILPMPTPQSRLITRGFNLPQLLVNKLIECKITASLTQTDFIQLPFFSQKQALKSRKQRLTYQHQFRLKKSRIPRKTTCISENLIIFDDILTTGTTAQQIAQFAKQQGVKTVAVWTISRAQ